jgi:hypothetical protein
LQKLTSVSAINPYGLNLNTDGTPPPPLPLKLLSQFDHMPHHFLLLVYRICGEKWIFVILNKRANFLCLMANFSRKKWKLKNPFGS